MLESSKKPRNLIRHDTYNYPRTAPMAKVGVKIPPGVGQLKVIAVNKNFCTKNMIKNPSYKSHLPSSSMISYPNVKFSLI
jgi:hypothetical protein